MCLPSRPSAASPLAGQDTFSLPITANIIAIGPLLIQQMIGDNPILRPDRAPFIAAHPASDLTLSIGCNGGMNTLRFGGIKSRGKNSQSVFAIAKLRTFRFAADHQPGGPMSQLDAGFNLVPVLATRAASARCHPFQISGADRELGRSGFGEYGYGDSRSVDAPMSFIGRNSLPTMTARFISKSGVATRAANPEYGDSFALLNKFKVKATSAPLVSRKVPTVQGREI